ncbi:MAG TPA: DUF1269 domain-containing protein [Acidimicrobiales bacterium]|nr:DUF1269 domain-containing protein [Acidimicrobiales bacterium]
MSTWEGMTMTDLDNLSSPSGAAGGSREHLVCIAFDKPNRATEVLVNLMHLQQEGAVRIGDAVIVTKDENGRARTVETVDVTPGKGALMGTWWGLLAGLFVGPLAIVGGAAAGALYGKLVDKGLADDWVGQMSDWLEAGRSALLLLVTVENKGQLLKELNRYGGELISTDVPDPLREELEHALQSRTAPSYAGVVGPAEEGGERPALAEDGDVTVDRDLEDDQRRL